MANGANGATLGRDVKAEILVPSPLLKQVEPPAPPNWTAIAAIAISVFTLIKTLITDWRAKRFRRASKFETDYGNPVRTGLRAYQKIIFSLRVYTVANARSLNSLKAEIETERSKWIEGADEILRLLQEVDDSGTALSSDWSKQFKQHSDTAEEKMLTLTDPSVADTATLIRFANEIQEELNVGIVKIQSALRAEVESHEKWFKFR